MALAGTRPTSARTTFLRLTGAALLLALPWVVFVGLLATRRHDNLHSNAFDLGYVAQVLWNTVHGRPFRFSTLVGAPFEVEGVQAALIRHPSVLFSFHVEPALLAVAPLYALWPDPRLLLWLQAAILGLGALPAAWLARRALASSWAGLVAAAAYLLAPGLEGAALSDFHMVALAAPLLLLALDMWERGQRRTAALLLAFVALCREDAALTVAFVGLDLWLLAWRASPAGRRGWWRNLGSDQGSGGGRVGQRMALAIAAGAAVWTGLCFGIIAPLLNGQGSVFWARYNWLGATPERAVLGLVRDPGLLLRWLAQADVWHYLLIELLTGGVVALAAPLRLLAALPVLAVNGLSSFSWMRSGGGHYSALLAPLLLWAGIHGAGRVAGWLRALPWPRLLEGARGPGTPSSKATAHRMLATLPLLALLVSVGAAQAWIGASPLRAGFAWPAADARAAEVRSALRAVPTAAALSSTSGIYPHLANRRAAFWFPAYAAAQWLAIDTVGTSHPQTYRAQRNAVAYLLESGQFRLVSARAGLLLLRRESVPKPGALAALPPAYLNTILLTQLPVSATRIGPVHFGTQLALLAYQLRRTPTVGLQGDSLTLDTYWQRLNPVAEQLRFTLATTRASDGALFGLQPNASGAALWYSPSAWPDGAVVHLEMSLDGAAGIRALGVAVVNAAGQRLPVSGLRAIWADGTIAPVALVS